MLLHSLPELAITVVRITINIGSLEKSNSRVQKLAKHTKMKPGLTTTNKLICYVLELQFTDDFFVYTQDHDMV